MSTLTFDQPSPEARRDTRGVVRLDARQMRSQRRITLALTVVPPVAVVAGIISMWGSGITGPSLAVLIAFYTVTVVGITVGYHRLFTHQSYVANKALRVMLAVAGSMAVEGSIISWVATHRRHHAFADTYGDPHSPHLAQAAGLRGVILGLWHAHVGWLFDPEQTDAREWAPDLLADSAIVRVDRAFPKLVLATFLLPPVAGFVITRTWQGALLAFIWGSLVRIFLLHHVTWSINSICHFYGKEAYRARGESRNVWPLAVPSFGESWHNNHHAFPWSAKMGLRAWQIDPGWYTICLFRSLGYVEDVKVPTKEQMRSRLRTDG